MASKKQAPDEGVFLLHIDDFLNAMHEEVKAKTGNAPRESLSAFAKAHARKGIVKQTEAQWRSDYQNFLNEIPK